MGDEESSWKFWVAQGIHTLVFGLLSGSLVSYGPSFIAELLATGTVTLGIFLAGVAVGGVLAFLAGLALVVCLTVVFHRLLVDSETEFRLFTCRVPLVGVFVLLSSIVGAVAVVTALRPVGIVLPVAGAIGPSMAVAAWVLTDRARDRVRTSTQ